ncbi:MAG: hypothetical protein M0Z60_00660 [Nitrospiraceae bacterium]|nr:hypothetical protein [Nitrospiraceae bacterium]
MERRVIYFEKPGKENSGACLDVARQAAAEGGYGADTVMVLKSAASKRLLDLRVLEILAKPRA